MADIIGARIVAPPLRAGGLAQFFYKLTISKSRRPQSPGPTTHVGESPSSPASACEHGSGGFAARGADVCDPATGRIASPALR
jgi:hypothetical protein